MATIKLQVFLAHAGIASRRKSEQLILDGVVTVNGETAHLGQRIKEESDFIQVKGKLIKNTTSKEYFILNKPRGIVSTTHDELNRKHVVDLLPVNKRQGMYPVGRLDQDSEGLILLTNDGELCNMLTHPKFEIEKTYHVLLKGIPSTLALEHLKRGVKLGGMYVRPVKINVLTHENNNTWLAVVIKEGQKHQVRKMIARIGYDVVRLVRVQMGPLVLGEIKNGAVRELTQEEKAAILEIKKSH